MTPRRVCVAVVCHSSTFLIGHQAPFRFLYHPVSNDFSRQVRQRKEKSRYSSVHWRSLRQNPRWTQWTNKENQRITLRARQQLQNENLLEIQTRNTPSIGLSASCFKKRSPPSHMEVQSLSRVRLFVTPWTVAHQASPSMGFPSQEYWSGLPFPSPGNLLHPGIEPRSPALKVDALPPEPQGRLLSTLWWPIWPMTYMKKVSKKEWRSVCGSDVQLGPTVCDPIDCKSTRLLLHGILPARILK